MRWIDGGNNSLVASRPMPDCVCQFIYTISFVDGGFTAEACNTAYGACRVAVKDTYCTEASVFENLEDLMVGIENGDIYWLYTSHCNCVGSITKAEY